MKWNKIRESVSEAYTKAISKATPSCCGSNVGDSNRCGAVADLAGYTEQQFQASPEAAGASFACGNPLAFSDVQEGDVVLDLGSGAGFDLLLAAEKVGTSGKVIGVDMTDAMLEVAQKNIIAAGVGNIELRKGIIEKMPVDDASVDWVISNCVVNLSPEKDKVFAEIYRVLKPGGRMLVSDIVVQDLPDEIRQMDTLYNSCVAGAISEEEYVSGLNQAGLDEVQVLDRFTYEASQIKCFFDTDEVPDLKTMFVDMGKNERKQAIDRLLEMVSGKVWSAKFSAVKP